jgi:valyl-tRNA synthetase
MSSDLAKTYDPAAVEPEAYRVWLEEKCFHPDPAAPGEPYCIVIPPPNVTGALHLGHAINDTLQDILIRQHRMRGFNTLWIPGIDHAGIATQAVVEKQLKEKENLTRHDVGREGLVERIWIWKQQYGDRILEQLKRLGCSCDWDRTRFTLDDMCARAVRETFFKLFKDGLIYRGKRLVNWDTFLQTSISDDEIYHETVKTFLWHIKYEIVEGEGGERHEGTEARRHEGNDASRQQYMVVATTRPETLLGDTAVAVHSEDARWNWAIGMFARLPLTGRLIPIIADDILVDPKFGTGVVKVTPAHDPNDYAVWQRHRGEIDIINILTPDGRINENGRPYAGLRRDQARKKVVEDLTAQGLLVKEEPYETEVGHSDRSKTPIEPYLSDQWFVKMAPLAEPALQVVRDGVIKFFPERHAQQYLAWLGEKRDWPISRQLWWGHRIPVWHRRLAVAPGTRDYAPHLSLGNLSHALFKLAPQTFGVACKVETGRPLTLQECESLCETKLAGEYDVYICTLNTDYAKYYEYRGFVQDADVLDTWFSSALWPHSTLGWPEHTPELQRWYPTSVLLTGRDIITLWVARMVMTGMYNMGQRAPGLSPSPGTPGEGRGEGDFEQRTTLDIPNHPHPSPLPEYRARGPEGDDQAKRLGIPFRHVVINPTILDGKGERMSKSKGNGVDPVEIIEIYGADALRFTLTNMATETQDARMPVKKDANGRNTSEKFDLGRNFCNKLWNACRFALSNLETVNPEPMDATKGSMVDRWIIARLHRSVAEANAALETYRFDQYAKACYDFFWRDLCDWYIEAIKPAMKDPARAGQTANVLAAVLDAALRLMHPMIPFITETIWWRLNEVRPERGLPGVLDAVPSKRLVQAAWPTVRELNEPAETIFPKIQELIGAIRNLRNEYNVDKKKSVSVSIATPGDSGEAIQTNREIIELLAICRLKQVRSDLSPIANAARAQAAGCEIFIEDLVNAETQTNRQNKQCEDLLKQRSALLGRLANESYTAKAPPHLVQQTRDQLKAVEDEMKKLGCG